MTYDPTMYKPENLATKVAKGRGQVGSSNEQVRSWKSAGHEEVDTEPAIICHAAESAPAKVRPGTVHYTHICNPTAP